MQLVINGKGRMGYLIGEITKPNSSNNRTLQRWTSDKGLLTSDKKITEEKMLIEVSVTGAGGAMSGLDLGGTMVGDFLALIVGDFSALVVGDLSSIAASGALAIGGFLGA